MTIAILSLAVLLVVCFIFFEVKGHHQLALFLKGLASFGFILVLISVVYEKLLMPSSLNYVGESFLVYLPLALLILCGLICGLLGDVFLALRPIRPKEEDRRIIISGIVAFAIGHIFYYVVLLVLGEFSWLAVIVSVLAAIIIGLGSYLLKYNMGITKIPAIIYSALIFLMVGQALSLAINENFNLFTTLILIGAILFAVSDLILSQIYYAGKDKPAFIIPNLFTYYSAQLLIAVSMLFIL